MSLEFIFEPRRWITHINESIVLDDAGPLRQLSYDFLCPGSDLSSTAEAWFPVLATPLGSQAPTPEVWVDGARSALLDDPAARSAEAELLAAVVGCELSGPLDETLIDLCREVIQSMRTTRMERITKYRSGGRSSKHDVTASDPSSLEIHASDLPSSIDRRTELLQALQNSSVLDLVRFFAKTRVSFVPILIGEPRTRRKITVSVRSEYFSRKRGPRNKFRTTLGFRPFVFRCEVPASTLTNSYDFELAGPGDHFVRWEGWVVEKVHEKLTQEVERTTGQAESETRVIKRSQSGRLVAKSGEDGITSPRTKVSSVATLSSSPSIHDGPPVQAFVVFNEKPPGSIATTCIYALVCLVTLAAGAFTFKNLIASEGIGADTAVILFSLPGTVALWLRPGRKGDRLVDPPLLATMSAFIVGFASYLAAVVFLLSDSASFGKCPTLDECEFSDGMMRVVGSADNWADPPVYLGDRPLAVAGHTVTGQLVLNALAAVVVLLALALVARAFSGARQYSDAQRLKRPRPLPSKLLGSDEVRQTDGSGGEAGGGGASTGEVTGAWA